MFVFSLVVFFLRKRVSHTPFVDLRPCNFNLDRYLIHSSIAMNSLVSADYGSSSDSSDDEHTINTTNLQNNCVKNFLRSASDSENDSNDDDDDSNSSNERSKSK